MSDNDTICQANVRCNACTRSLVGVTTANAGTDSQCQPHGNACGLYGLKLSSPTVWVIDWSTHWSISWYPTEASAKLKADEGGGKVIPLYRK